MTWLQISFEVDRDAVGSAAETLEATGAQSVTMTDAGQEPVLEPHVGETPLWSRTRLTGLFRLDETAAATAASLQQALATIERTALHVTRLEDRAWERVWLETFRPMRFGRRLWICPHGRKVEAPGSVVIRLDPGLAFGTGTHPTTAMCLEWLDAAQLTGATVVDYGCGSGILAIAAARLGAARAIAVDHDPQALTAAIDNARRNQVADSVYVCAPDAMQDVSADIVIANILAEPLIDLAAVLAGHTKPGGTLVLSGILEAQGDGVERAYRRWCTDVSRRVTDGWVRLEMRRPGQED